MKKIILLSVISILGLSTFGCSPNERVYYKNNVACSASNRMSEEWRYYTIELGTPNIPYKGQPSIDIFIPGITEFASNSITTKNILNIKDAEVLDMIAIENTPNVGSWSESAKQILCGSFLSFVIENDKVLQIKIANSGKIRLSGTQKWYNLPCSEAEIIEIFGRPDRTYEWFRE